jgi:MFS family permease
MNDLLQLSFSRKGRLLMSILGPPLVGGLVHSTILLFLLFFFEDAPLEEKIFSIGVLVVLSVVWAYIFVGVQALVAGLLMEYVIRRLATRKFHIVVSAAVMGLLAAGIYRIDLPFNLFLGFSIGTCLGLFLSHSFQTVQSDNNSK